MDSVHEYSFRVRTDIGRFRSWAVTIRRDLVGMRLATHTGMHDELPATLELSGTVTGTRSDELSCYVPFAAWLTIDGAVHVARRDVGVVALIAAWSPDAERVGVTVSVINPDCAPLLDRLCASLLQWWPDAAPILPVDSATPVSAPASFPAGAGESLSDWPVYLNSTPVIFASWLERFTANVYARKFPNDTGWWTLQRARIVGQFPAGGLRFAIDVHYNDNRLSANTGEPVHFVDPRNLPVTVDAMPVSESRLQLTYACAEPAVLDYIDELRWSLANVWPEAALRTLTADTTTQPAPALAARDTSALPSRGGTVSPERQARSSRPGRPLGAGCYIRSLKEIEQAVRKLRDAGERESKAATAKSLGVSVETLGRALDRFNTTWPLDIRDNIAA